MFMEKVILNYVLLYDQEFYAQERSIEIIWRKDRILESLRKCIIKELLFLRWVKLVVFEGFLVRSGVIRKCQRKISKGRLEIGRWVFQIIYVYIQRFRLELECKLFLKGFWRVVVMQSQFWKKNGGEQEYVIC